MKFKDYIDEAKKLKGTMVGFGIDSIKLKKIYDYIESWLIKFKIDYEIQKDPHFSIAIIPGTYNKDELVREMNLISKNQYFKPKKITILRGKNFKKDFISIEYKPNKEFIDDFNEISSKFDVVKFDTIRPHISLFIIEQDSKINEFYDDMIGGMPKLPKIKPSEIELWNQKFKREYVKK